MPAEAVEAAAKAAYELMPVELFGRDKPVTWEQLSDSPLGQRRKDKELTKARLGLEAAAPDLLAEAWDEGYDRAESDHYGTGFWATRLRGNPYRRPTK